MAEASNPPPGLDYNEFRTWRKSNGIKSGLEELLRAWKEYKQSVAVIEELLDSEKRPEASGQLEHMCRLPLTRDEILNSLDTIPLPIALNLKSGKVGGWLEGSHDFLFSKIGDKIRVRYTPVDVEEHIESPRVYILGFIKRKKWKLGDVRVSVSPAAGKALLLRRENCLSNPNFVRNVTREQKEHFLSLVSYYTQEVFAFNEFRLQEPKLREIVAGEGDAVWLQAVNEHAIELYKKLVTKLAWIAADSSLLSVWDSIDKNADRSMRITLKVVLDNVVLSLRNAYNAL